MQAPQPLQSTGFTKDFLVFSVISPNLSLISRISIALKGQTAVQDAQPMHFLSSTTATIGSISKYSFVSREQAIEAAADA